MTSAIQKIDADDDHKRKHGQPDGGKLSLRLTVPGSLRDRTRGQPLLARE